MKYRRRVDSVVLMGIDSLVLCLVVGGCSTRQAASDSGKTENHAPASNGVVAEAESMDTFSEKTVSTQPSLADDALVALIESPDRDSYLKIYKQLVQSKQYKPYSDEVGEASELFEAGKTKEARETLQGAMNNLILSPRAYDFLGFLHHKLGDEEQAERSLRTSFACIFGILSTGDGSEQQPYLVARTSDEYDVLRHLKKQSQQQSLIERDGRYFDRIECTDGSEFWFDITDSYNRIGELLTD